MQSDLTLEQMLYQINNTNLIKRFMLKERIARYVFYFLLVSFTSIRITMIVLMSLTIDITWIYIIIQAF